MYRLCVIVFIGIFGGAVAPSPPLTADDVLAEHIVTKYDTNDDGFLSDSEFIEISETYVTNPGLARAKFGNDFVFQDKSSIVKLFQDILQNFDTNHNGELTQEVLATFLKDERTSEHQKRFGAWIIYLADSSESGSSDIGFIDEKEKFWLDEYFGLKYTEEQSATAFKKLQQVIIKNGFDSSVVEDKILCSTLVELIQKHTNLYSLIFPLKSELTTVGDKANTDRTSDDDDDDEFDDDDDFWELFF